MPLVIVCLLHVKCLKYHILTKAQEQCVHTNGIDVKKAICNYVGSKCHRLKEYTGFSQLVLSRHLLFYILVLLLNKIRIPTSETKTQPVLMIRNPSKKRSKLKQKILERSPFRVPIISLKLFFRTFAFAKIVFMFITQYVHYMAIYYEN